MRWLKNLFSTHRDFTGDYIETGDEFLSLVASNEIVKAEYKSFLAATEKDGSEIEKEAIKSANALSGYGILVRSKALIASLE